MWFTPGSSTCQPFIIIKIIFQTFINCLIIDELENILGIYVKIIFVSVILAIFINSLSFCCKKLILAFLARKTSSLLTKACKKELHSATGETSTDKHRPHQTILNWSKCINTTEQFLETSSVWSWLNMLRNRWNNFM